MSNWKQSKRAGDWLLLANGLALVVLVNLLASDHFFRIDLTQEKRFTIQDPTRTLLKTLDDNVYVEVFLSGDLNPEFNRFQKSIRETLEEFKVYSGNRVRYGFTDPASALSQKAQNEFMASLAAKGIQGKRIIDNKNGEHSEKIVFPGALVSYGGMETGVMLLKGNPLQGSQEMLNESAEGVEFELANAIHKLTSDTRKRIGLLKGHGELDSVNIAGLTSALFEHYDVYDVRLDHRKSISGYDALILAKPRRPFAELDKFKLDQYIMNGGKVIFLVDRFEASMDSASRANYFAFPLDVKLDDQLFKYGVRINEDLIQDKSSATYPVVVNESGNRPQVVPLEWPFYPLITNYARHPITRNLDATLTRFISTIDTVKAIGIRKTPLLFTSSYTHRSAAPVRIDINDLRKQRSPDYFSQGAFPVAYLLEGEFSSLFKNRFHPEGSDVNSFLEKSKPTRLIVLADGDVARNDVNPRTGQPQALGFDASSGYTFANQDLLMNMVSYLVDENGLINARNKEVKLRPLDKGKLRDERAFWQVVNLVSPLIALAIFAVLRTWIRKRTYARF